MSVLSPTPRAGLITRLSSYWKLEAANMLFGPGAMVLLADAEIGAASIFTMAAMIVLLGIGAAYWRAKLHQIERSVSPDETVAWIATLDLPMAIASTLAACIAIAVWAFDGVAVGTADRWVATTAAVLTVLEYINYYHRQLQHFDHAADWKRLMSGKGFRKSQLRQDIERLRHSA